MNFYWKERKENKKQVHHNIALKPLDEIKSSELNEQIKTTKIVLNRLKEKNSTQAIKDMEKRLNELQAMKDEYYKWINIKNKQ